MSNDEHNCANCKHEHVPYIKEPCETCLEYRTQYPYWKAKG
jgi:hypothetical protein